MRTFQYGTDASQVGDLYLPSPPRPAVVCLLHGGFWRMPYSREEMTPIAEDLVRRGFAVWNLEYRRVGAPGGGWPGTFEDVVAGIDHLATLAAEGADLDLDRIQVAGHSAGGHLALLAAACERKRRGTAAALRVNIAAAAGLAPIVDLAKTYEQGAGNQAARDFLGGSPQEQPARYAAASPITLLPTGVSRQLILHGEADTAVPIELSRAYVKAASRAGDPVELFELPATGHMDFLDPTSHAHTVLCRWLELLGGHRPEGQSRQG